MNLMTLHNLKPLKKNGICNSSGSVSILKSNPFIRGETKQGTLFFSPHYLINALT